MLRLNLISNSFSPNTQKDDILLAYKISYQLWKWKNGKEIGKLEEEFKKYFSVDLAVSFNSGRSALIAILNALEIDEGDEVLLQAFTCSAAVNPILKFRAKPVFVDIDETLNMSPEDLESKITEKSNVVMIQHTFGNPAKIDKIKEICKKHNLFLIEDCAHALGAKYKGKLCGTFGDASFFSFGRDKIISSVYGGMAISNNIEIVEKMNYPVPSSGGGDGVSLRESSIPPRAPASLEHRSSTRQAARYSLSAKIKKFQQGLPFPKRSWIFQQINHPIIFSNTLPVYSFLNIGKAYLYISQKLKMVSPSVYPKEKIGQVPEYFPKKMPNASAVLALNQFRKLEKFNARRKEIAKIYNREFFNIKVKENENSEPIYMRYPVFAYNAKEIRVKLKKQNIFLDDGWHSSAIVPPSVNLEKMHYKKGSCPRAENTSQKIVNLPTGIRIQERTASRVAKKVKEFIKI